MRVAMVLAGPSKDKLKVVGASYDPLAVGVVAKFALADMLEVKDPDLRRLASGRRSALRKMIADGYNAG